MLVDLPAPIMEAAKIRDVQRLAVYGTRTRTQITKDDYIQVRTVEENNIAQGALYQFWLETSLDPSQPTQPTKPLKELIRSFESFEGIQTNPIYVDSKDVDNTEHRSFYGLPSISTIYPLRGNYLATTTVGFAGIHTPWMYFSEGFGTYFALRIEDFNLASLNIVLAGAPKLWTVVPLRIMQSS